MLLFQVLPLALNAAGVTARGVRGKVGFAKMTSAANIGSSPSLGSLGGGAAETRETRETREAQRRRQWATAGACMAQRSSAELARQRQGPGSRAGGDQRWRTTQINNDYGLCATYPQLLSVPAGASDVLRSRAAKYRSKCRIPALVWRHPTLKSVLCRSAQPLTGLSGAAVPEDEELLHIIRRASLPEDAGHKDRINHPPPMYIFDARPKLNARGNALMGKGFENVDRLNKGGAASGDADGFRLIFLNIDNIHAMRNSLQGLGAAVQVGSSNNDDASEAWSEALHKTKWLQVKYEMRYYKPRIANLY